MRIWALQESWSPMEAMGRGMRGFGQAWIPGSECVEKARVPSWIRFGLPPWIPARGEAAVGGSVDRALMPYLPSREVRNGAS